MGGEGSLLSWLLGDWYLPVTFSKVQCGNVVGSEQPIDTVVLSGYWEGVRFGHCIELPVINAEAG